MSARARGLHHTEAICITDRLIVYGIVYVVLELDVHKRKGSIK